MAEGDIIIDGKTLPIDNLGDDINIFATLFRNIDYMTDGLYGLLFTGAIFAVLVLRDFQSKGITSSIAGASFIMTGFTVLLHSAGLVQVHIPQIYLVFWGIATVIRYVETSR